MYSKNNPADVEFIEKWYHDVEQGYHALGKTYERPKDYIERALRVMNLSKKRSRLLNQYEGRKSGFHEEI